MRHIVQHQREDQVITLTALAIHSRHNPPVHVIRLGRNLQALVTHQERSLPDQQINMKPHQINQNLKRKASTS